MYFTKFDFVTRCQEIKIALLVTFGILLVINKFSFVFNISELRPSTTFGGSFFLLHNNKASL